MATITIIGGHGKIALLTEPLLVRDGHTVNAVIRNRKQSADVMAHGANPVVADITRLSTEQMVTLFTDLGTEVLIFSAGAGGGSPERTYAIDRDAAIRTIDAAKTAGISRYVMVSYLGAGAGHGIDPNHSFYAYAQAKAAADEHLRGSELNYTLLGPGPLTLEDAGGISVGVGLAHQQQRGATPRATVARVIQAVVSDPTTIGKAIPFTGGTEEISRALANAPDGTQLR